VGKFDNLNDSQVADIWKAIRDLQTASPNNNSAIGRGGLLVYDGGVITIENGGLVVTGEASIIGRLVASGIIDFTGDVTISGPLDVEGLMTLVGDLVVASGGKITAGSIELNPDGSAKFGTMTISPAGKITSGSAEINPDGSVKFGSLTIDTNGKVTAGGMTIDPALFGGSIQFAAGGYLSGTASGPQLTGPSGNAFVYAKNGVAGIQAASVELVGDVTAQGGLKVTFPGTTTGVPANLYMDGAGNIRKII
jgi:hypothetical protein